MPFQRNIKLLTLFNFFTDFQLYSPIVILYFASITHSYALAALLFSIQLITLAIADIPTGIYSDIIGRKKTVVIGAIFAVLYTTVYAIGINFWILAIGAVFEGLSRAFYSGNNDALLHNMLAEEGLEGDYHTHSGKLSSMFQFGLAISAVIGGFVANSSFSLVMWLSVIPQIMCLILALQLTDVKRIQSFSHSSLYSLLKEAVKEFVSNSNLRLLSIGSIIAYGTGEAAYQFRSVFFQMLWPIWALGIAKAISNMGAAVSFYFAGKVIDKIGFVKIILLDDVVGTVLNLVALVFPTVLSPLLLSATSILYGSSNTAERTLMQKEFTDKQRATMSSLNSFAGYLLFGIYAPVLGFFADKYGPVKPLIATQLLVVIVFLLHYKLLRQTKLK